MVNLSLLNLRDDTAIYLANLSLSVGKMATFIGVISTETLGGAVGQNPELRALLTAYYARLFYPSM